MQCAMCALILPDYVGQNLCLVCNICYCYIIGLTYITPNLVGLTGFDPCKVVHGYLGLLI